MGPECACGCGETLPEGSSRAYKRGHKQRMIRAENAELARKDKEFFGDADVIPEQPEDPLSAIARDVPDDPEPAIFKKGVKERRSPLKLTPNVRKDVEGKVAFLLLTTSNAIQLIDPVCGGSLLEQSADIAEKLTPILCQSPAVVEWFQKGTSIMMYVELLMVLAPVATTFFNHHLSKAEEPMPETPFTNDYYGIQR